jgi:protein gp37
MPHSTIIIEPELQAFLPPLSGEELADLEAKLLAEGCQDALVLWQETQTLVDGHHRYALCQKHALPFQIRALSFPDLDSVKAWMIVHQLARRQLTDGERSYYRGKQYELQKQGSRGGGDHKSREAKNQKGKSYPFENEQSPSVDTAEILAQEHKVSQKTIKNDAAFAKDVDTITQAVGPTARQTLLGRRSQTKRKHVKQVVKLVKSNPQTAAYVLEQVDAAQTPKEAETLIAEAVKHLPVLAPEKSVTTPAPVPALTLIMEEPPKQGLETILTVESRAMFILHKPDSTSVFNKTNEMVDWASWTWNPVTGCWHGCDYCYAREIAHLPRMADDYPKQFEPTFHPARLDAPRNTAVPKELKRPADKNVFTCSMADLFGKWVPEDWIRQIFERVRLHPEWNFLFLTKFPQRLQDVCTALGGFPPNAWVGCTVDSQARVATAERAFRAIQASVRWLSVEPMRERLTFQSLDMFDWLVIGGQSPTGAPNNTPAFQPEWEWVEHLWRQARAAGVKIYWKENLSVRPKEVPWS